MDWSQIVLIVFIGLLIIAYPILVSSRNKKENQKLQEQTNSLKRGDKILTTSGVYGTIVDLQMDNEKKIVTIETGSGTKKSYMAVDAYAIYTVFKDEDKKAQAKVDDKKAEPAKDEKVQNQAEKTAISAEKPVLNTEHDSAAVKQEQKSKDKKQKKA